jgi:predicted ArsR family transcriptional regulator
MRYPDEPGFKGDPNGPGADAARRYSHQVGRRQRQVLDGLGAGPKNAEQISQEIGLHWYLIRPRLTELEQKGLIVKSGQRGRSALGGRSTMYRPSTEAERADYCAHRTKGGEA